MARSWALASLCGDSSSPEGWADLPELLRGLERLCAAAPAVALATRELPVPGRPRQGFALRAGCAALDPFVPGPVRRHRPPVAGWTTGPAHQRATAGASMRDYRCDGCGVLNRACNDLTGMRHTVTARRPSRCGGRYQPAEQAAAAPAGERESLLTSDGRGDAVA
jgi:hypothetical protein